MHKELSLIKERVLININALITDKYCNQIKLLYYLFMIGDIYKNNEINKLALEIIKRSLTESELINNTLEAYHMGWLVIQLKKLKIIEIDDIDGILYPLDRSIQGIISNLSIKNNIRSLVNILLYLDERSGIQGEMNDEDLFKILKYVQTDTTIFLEASPIINEVLKTLNRSGRRRCVTSIIKDIETTQSYKSNHADNYFNIRSKLTRLKDFSLLKVKQQFESVLYPSDSCITNKFGWVFYILSRQNLTHEKEKAVDILLDEVRNISFSHIDNLSTLMDLSCILLLFEPQMNKKWRIILFTKRLFFSNKSIS